MRPGATDEVMAGVVGYDCIVSSWLGGSLLAASVPVASGRLVCSATQDAPESLTMRVPRFVADATLGRTFDWLPGDGDASHPLARYGQELDVSVVVRSSVTKGDTVTRLARILIQSTRESDNGTVEVSGVGVLRHALTDLLTSPIQPTGTLASEARRLVPAGMGVSVDPALTDRACPQSMVWSSNRLDALQEIADAWPALLRCDEWGQVRFRAPLDAAPDPIVTLHDGEGGTVAGAPRSDSRDAAFNRVIARSSASGVEGVYAVAEVTSGPMAAAGPYRPVTREWASPLIATTDQAAASARTMLGNSPRPAKVLPVTCAADPRYELDDPVAVVVDGVTTWGWIVGIDLPLKATDGDMRVDVSAP